MFIPKLKYIERTNVADLICGIQPMMRDDNNMFKLRMIQECDHPQFKEGDIRHSFLDGWQTFYGGEWIPTSVWTKIKICGF